MKPNFRSCSEGGVPVLWSKLCSALICGLKHRSILAYTHKTDTHRGQKKKEVSGVFLILWSETRKPWPLSFLFLDYARKKAGKNIFRQAFQI